MDSRSGGTPATAHVAGKRILVTGGGGTIGSRLVDHLLTCDVEVVRVLGRDETKQFYQRVRYRGRADVRFLIGDIRDRERMLRATDGIDIVFHCAALKHVESSEYNPFEAAQTNVIGTQNIIDACLTNGVRTMIFTSSDKAANPTSVMGASKLLAEKLVTAATNYRGGRPTTFASVRFGNVLGSRGSAVELFAAQIAAGGPVTMTNPEMTRFVMSTDRAVSLALEAARHARGGEVYVFKMPVARLEDLVTSAIAVFAPKYGRVPSHVGIDRIPVRPGEKAYEELMTEDESLRARDIGPMYAVLPRLDTGDDTAVELAHYPAAPTRAYRSDGVNPMSSQEVEAVLRSALEEFAP